MNKHTKILAVILLGLFIAYNLFGLKRIETHSKLGLGSIKNTEIIYFMNNLENEVKSIIVYLDLESESEIISSIEFSRDMYKHRLRANADSLIKFLYLANDEYIDLLSVYTDIIEKGNVTKKLMKVLVHNELIKHGSFSLGFRSLMREIYYINLIDQNLAQEITKTDSRLKKTKTIVNGLAIIFWAGVLYVVYSLLLVSMRIERKKELKEYKKKHKTTFKTYEDLNKCLESSILIMPILKKKLKLPNVTLLAATFGEEEEVQIAMRISQHNIEFGSVKLLCSSPPRKKYPDIDYVSVPPVNTHRRYQQIIFQDLHKYFKTSHCLTVQADGFVVNADLWKEEFLKFDYIGAPWPNKVQINPNFIINVKKNCVGNGGFSLRTRKLVETTAKINFNSLKFSLMHEDIIICHYLYKEMIDKGVRFAPPKLAAQFSIEETHHLYGQNVNSVFGFHGKHFRDYFIEQYLLRTPIGEW